MKKIVVSDKSVECDLQLVPGKNVLTATKDFINYFNEITTLETDLLVLSSSIFAADLACKRNEREDFIRSINISIDVVNLHAFERVKDNIELALYTLSNDNWEINFNQKSGSPEKSLAWPKNEGVVLLFSGGLDSLAGASKFLGKNIPLHLVSHVTHNNVVRNAQNSMIRHLSQAYKIEINHSKFFVSGRTTVDFPFPSGSHREDTQRTRSFLFLTLAALVARRIGFSKLITVAENGQFAIHLPLTAARIGSFSTHTAHPEFLHYMQSILRTILGLENLEIENPFLYKTKSEVVDSLNVKLKNVIYDSVSCWRSSRVSGKRHCGECIPCISRRIALETINISLDEYKRDIFQEDLRNLPTNDIGKRNLIDLIEFITYFQSLGKKRREELLLQFPELYNEYIDQKKAIDMYMKFSDEALRIFNKYPAVKSLL